VAMTGAHGWTSEDGFQALARPMRYRVAPLDWWAYI
jgi:hypothetical protein